MSSKYTVNDLVNATFNFMKETSFETMLEDFVDKWMSRIGEFPVAASAGDASVFGDAVSSGLSLIRKMNEDGHSIRLADGSCIEGMHRESNLLLLTRLATHHFKPKNTDYGDAFERFGETGILIRMDDKVLRMKSLMGNPAKVAGESMSDTIVDFTVYAMMALMLKQRSRDMVIRNANDDDAAF